MTKDREQEPGLEQTLETLKGVLDPAAFQLAKSALEADVSGRREAAEKAADQLLITQLIEGYDYAMERSKAGYAHVEGLLIESAKKYLMRKAGSAVDSELDGKARLFSAYVFCRDYDAIDDPESVVEIMRSAYVNPDDVFDLIRQYWEKEEITFGEGWPVPQELEGVLGNEMIHGDTTWEYYPAPGLAEEIRTKLEQVSTTK